MANVSRAGRKAQIKVEVYRHWKRTGGLPIDKGHIARRIGMKSSTDLGKMMLELVDTDDNICLYRESNPMQLIWIPFTNLTLPERFIIINGNQYPVAKWVADKREFSDDSAWARAAQNE